MKSTKSSAFRISPGLIVSVILLAVLAWAFKTAVFKSDYVIFSNDGPLGLQKAAFLSLPQAFLGQWYDLQSIGSNSGAALPGVSSLIKWVLGPVGYAKFLIPISLWLLGGAAYFCFRRCGLSGMASVVGGLAAALTTNYFSNSCWGAAPPIIAFGMDFLAIGALVKRDDKMPFWVAPALAGLAVGINVMEAADIGALFSVLVAAFVMYESLSNEGPSIAERAARGAGRTLIVTIFALFIAAYAVSALIGTAISGISGTKQDEATKAAHWDFATEWSLPKHETLALAVPNLFGCSIITPGSANYWGGIGSDPSWERYLAAGEKGPMPQGFMRHTGRGIYIGVLVIFIAFWAALQSLRGNDSVFNQSERRLIWFWMVVAFVSLLLAWGRWAWFYRILYVAVPYFSSIRNPEKFIHIITFATLIMFAYGVHGLHRRYLGVPFEAPPEGRLRSWWAKAPAFDKRWVIGSALVICLMLVGWVVYAHLRGNVEDYLVKLQRIQSHNSPDFDAKSARAFSTSQLSFSLHQVGWCVLFLTAGSALLFLIFSGFFAGRWRALLAGALLGALITGDLLRANQPYIIYWNYEQKYETYGPDPVIKFLANKPYEHRVSQLPFRPPPQLSDFINLYGIEWTQQLFPFYNIQSLDIVQMPRMPQDLEAFQLAMQFPEAPPFTRLWELTANRYLLGPTGFFDGLNQQLDPALHRFRIVTSFDIVPRPYVSVPAGVPLDDLKRYAEILPLNDRTAAPAPDKSGDYSLFEFTGALPRAILYSQWETNSPSAIAGFTTNGLSFAELAAFQMAGTNDFLTLKRLASPSFNPAKSVLLPKALPVVPHPSTTNQDSGSVKITSYEPADIKLEATPTAPSVLMLVDKYDPAWQVWVDGKRGEVLRCNFLMRGVYLEPGRHEVEFLFRPNVQLLWVDVAAIFIGFCLLGYAFVVTQRHPANDERESEPK